jgi:RNA polymerase sigma-70 factor (ECF subfamily)
VALSNADLSERAKKYFKGSSPHICQKYQKAWTMNRPSAGTARLEIFKLFHMNTFAFPALEDGSVVPIASPAARKIIQRISRPRVSDSLNQPRMGDTDYDLVLQSQNGNPAAFELLIRNHQRMIHSLTFRMTGSSADAEDLAQETFLRAYEQLGSFRGQAKFSTWLYRIAVNNCLNWRQSETRRCRLHANCAEEMSAAHGTNGTAPPGDQANQQVQSALLKLSAKQRAAIVLTIYDGLNHAEAANLLGCSENTISWRVFAARRKLKRWLAHTGGTP